MPGGFGTLDELFESLTLIQTGKVRKMPILLVGSSFWRGLVQWFQEHLVNEGMISPQDLDLVYITDSPQEIVERIFHHYETRGFDPLPQEQDQLLNL